MIPGTVVDPHSGLVIWAARPAGLRIGMREGAVSIAAPDSASTGCRQVCWEGDPVAAQRLAWAVRTRRHETVRGVNGTIAHASAAPFGGGMWLVLSGARRTVTVVLPDSECEQVADAIVHAAVISQLDGGPNRPEWAVLHHSVATALEALLDLGLPPAYLRSVLP